MIIALEEPTEPVRRKFQILYALANAGTTMALIPVLNILIPAQVTRINPANSATNLAIVLTSGAAGALIGNPLTGSLSDRTTSRFGRRTPWILMGMLAASIGLLIMANNFNIVTLAAGWFLVQFFGNMLLACYSAILPDRVPVFQRGTTQAIIGLAAPITMVLGAFYLGRLVDLKIGYYSLAALLIVLTIAFLISFREPQLPKGALPSFEIKSFLKSFWINPRQYPNFGISWAFWFLAWSGYGLGSGGFLYLYLQNILRYPMLFPGHAPQEGIATIQILQIVVGVPLMIIAGIISDKKGVRKIFVTGGASLVLLGLLLLGLIRSWLWIEFATTLVGAGFWIYYTIGIAMISEFLPSAAARGKDLGVINVAATLPQILMPWLGAAVINGFGASSPTGYLILFSLGSILVFLGLILLQRIKNIR
jgi:MFS family permease